MHAEIPTGAVDHLCTVVLEDFFESEALASLIPPSQWYRFESRLEIGATALLDLFERHCVRATWFVSERAAREHAGLIRRIAAHGHELACGGLDLPAFGDTDAAACRDVLLAARGCLEQLVGRRVHGFRTMRGALQLPRHEWILRLLEDCGFAYDASCRPSPARVGREPWSCQPYRHMTDGGSLWEIPEPTAASWRRSAARPYWLRLSKRSDVQTRLDQFAAAGLPVHMTIRPWELDPEQPRITAAPRRVRSLQYRHLEKTQATLEHVLRAHRFGAIGDWLGLEDQAIEAAPVVAVSVVEDQAPVVSARNSRLATPVSIVVPCFNEEASLDYLERTLRSVSDSLAGDYELRYVFVDDGSSDATWRRLIELFGDRSDCHLIRHPQNRGVAAAILTGARATDTEIVCSIDSDCTYDPHQLAGMIPLLDESVDVVTASPYHRLGRVANVPAWRLSLSRTLSMLYRRVLRQKLATYTSCFRVYRRSALQDLSLRENGFLGVAEILGFLDLQGARIVEFPAVLEVRLLGHSKMKVLATIAGHLRLLARMRLARWRYQRG